VNALAAADEARLLEIARASVAHGLRRGHALPLDAAVEAPALREPGASFVTLRTARAELRGCVGSLEAERALAADVAENAFRAAFRDPRFAPVARDELEALELSIAILGLPERIEVASAEALAAALVGGRDGVILRQGKRRATFLPEVWASLPDPHEFVRALERKAGIASWGAGVEAFRYAVRTLGGRRA
jgi:AmmeMemoRadiSam system protein A